MTDSLRLSVIIAAYNEERTIEAIDRGEVPISYAGRTYAEARRSSGRTASGTRPHRQVQSVPAGRRPPDPIAPYPANSTALTRPGPAAIPCDQAL